MSEGLNGSLVSSDRNAGVLCSLLGWLSITTAGKAS